MSLYYRVIIVLSKLIGFFIQFLGLGSGSTWPGEVALRLAPSIFSYFSLQTANIILVSGTNGKTTTVKMLETILTTSGKKVKRNSSGANLDNGLASGFIEDSSWLGKLLSDYYIFEVDEATLAQVTSALKPRLILILNLFRDQLDRFGEIDAVANRWMNTFSTLSDRTHFILNGDDPHVVYIGLCCVGQIKYFGLENPSLYLSSIQQATDSLYCPNCGNRLTFGGVYYSHLGKWTCGKCPLTYPKLSITSEEIVSPLPGTYNIYNSLAGALAAKELGIKPQVYKQGLQKFTPAFGRFESIKYKDKVITLLLSKNPAGFNESLKTVVNSEVKGPILFLLNDRIPDGTDVSWIWDIDFESVIQSQRIFIASGDRSLDLAVRLKHASVADNDLKIYQDFVDAVNEGLSLVKENEYLWVLPTYSAMLDLRKYLTGKNIL